MGRGRAWRREGSGVASWHARPTLSARGSELRRACGVRDGDAVRRHGRRRHGRRHVHHHERLDEPRLRRNDGRHRRRAERVDEHQRRREHLDERERRAIEQQRELGLRRVPERLLLERRVRPRHGRCDVRPGRAGLPGLHLRLSGVHEPCVPHSGRLRRADLRLELLLEGRVHTLRQDGRSGVRHRRRRVRGLLALLHVLQQRILLLRDRCRTVTGKVGWRSAVALTAGGPAAVGTLPSPRGGSGRWLASVARSPLP